MYKACLYHSRLEGTESKQLFFARKFEPLIHQEIINRIDDWLGLTIGQGGDDERHHYWQNVYHHLGKF
jgi:protein xylosyltransferase